MGHYIPVKQDFSDLEDAVDWCLSHLAECEQIGANGRCWMQPFFDEEAERALISRVVEYSTPCTSKRASPTAVATDLSDQWNNNGPSIACNHALAEGKAVLVDVCVAEGVNSVKVICRGGKGFLRVWALNTDCEKEHSFEQTLAGTDIEVVCDAEPCQLFDNDSMVFLFLMFSVFAL